MYMNPDFDRGGFVVMNPITKKKKRFPREQEALAREAAKLLGEFIANRKKRQVLEAGRPTIAQLVDLWTTERLPFQPWDKSTRSTALNRLERIKTEMGDSLIDATDCVAIEAWLVKTTDRADPFNKWRYIWVLLFRLAVSRKFAPHNEAEKVEARSTSRKIKSNQKVRQQLDVPGFNEIHAKSEPWLQLAMETSLVTLQARNEVCNLKHADFRGGYIFVIRDKVAGDSSMAFIKIRITPELESIRARAHKLDDTVSPYVIHRRPDRMQRRWLDGKPHWTYVNEPYLTKAFAAARDQVERFAALPERVRPTFHEIRGLGARLCRLRGMARADIQAVMTHSSPDTTEIYLELGPQALTDDHFKAVSAPFTVRDLLGAG